MLALFVKMTKYFFVLLVAFSLIGCGNGLIKSIVETPQLKGVELKSFSIKDKLAVFEVALFNPNDFSLPISGLAGNMSVNQMTVGHIEMNNSQNLAAQSTQTVAVPVKLDARQLVDAVKAIVKLRQAHFIFNGGVDTTVGEIPFSKEGKLSFDDIVSLLINTSNL